MLSTHGLTKMGVPAAAAPDRLLPGTCGSSSSHHHPGLHNTPLNGSRHVITRQRIAP